MTTAASRPPNPRRILYILAAVGLAVLLATVAFWSLRDASKADKPATTSLGGSAVSGVSPAGDLAELLESSKLPLNLTCRSNFATDVQRLGRHRYQVSMSSVTGGVNAWFELHLDGEPGSTYTVDLRDTPNYFWRSLAPVTLETDASVIGQGFAADSWMEGVGVPTWTHAVTTEVYENGIRLHFQAGRGRTVVAMRQPYGLGNLTALTNDLAAKPSVKIRSLPVDARSQLGGLTVSAVVIGDPSTSTAGGILYCGDHVPGRDPAWLLEGAARALAEDTAKRRDWCWVVLVYGYPFSDVLKPPSFAGDVYSPRADAVANLLRPLVAAGWEPNIAVEMTTFQSSKNPPIKLDQLCSGVGQANILLGKVKDGLVAACHSADVGVLDATSSDRQHNARLAGFTRNAFGGQALYVEINADAGSGRVERDKLRLLGVSFGKFLAGLDAADFEADRRPQESMVRQCRSWWSESDALNKPEKLGYMTEKAVDVHLGTLAEDSAVDSSR